MGFHVGPRWTFIRQRPSIQREKDNNLYSCRTPARRDRLKDHKGLMWRVGECSPELICELVQRYSPPCGVVVDDTCGTKQLNIFIHKTQSGTGVAMLACLRLGRRGIGVDQDTNLINSATNRAKLYYRTLREYGLLPSLKVIDYNAKSVFKPIAEERLSTLFSNLVLISSTRFLLGFAAGCCSTCADAG